MTLEVVKLHPESKQQIASLHERLINVIMDFDKEQPQSVTVAEIIGTLEFVKKTFMDRA